MTKISPLRPIRTLASTAAVALTALLAVPTVASAQVDSGYTKYRCVVLADAQACPAPTLKPASELKVEVVPGPYAKYLMHLGQDAETAMETAQARGEVAMHRTVLVSTRQLTAQESHEKQMGRLATPATTYQILAEVPLEAPTEQVGLGASQDKSL